MSRANTVGKLTFEICSAVTLGGKARRGYPAGKSTKIWKSFLKSAQRWRWADLRSEHTYINSKDARAFFEGLLNAYVWEESAEAPPAADKATAPAGAFRSATDRRAALSAEMRFRGSGTIGGPIGYGNRNASTVSGSFPLETERWSASRTEVKKSLWTAVGGYAAYGCRMPLAGS